MNVVRGLERRLERLLEGVAGKVFTGRLHPSEIAGRLAREADLARFEHETGPATANVYTLVVNPRDMTSSPADLERSLTAELDAYTALEGLRLEGPCQVRIIGSHEVAPGGLMCHVEVVPGVPVIWARLNSGGESHGIGRNRALIGRSSTSDVVVAHDDVSRSHALIWRQGGEAWIRDLGSANGTTVDGKPVGADQTIVQSGSLVTLASRRFRFLEL